MSQQINLYNPTLLPRREWVTGRNLALAMGALVVLLFLMAGVAQYHLASNSARAKAAEAALNQTKGQLEEVGRSLAARRVPVEQDPELRKVQQAVADRKQVLAQLEQGSPRAGQGFGDYFRGLARQSVAGLWLTGFSVGADGNGLEIRGRMTDQSLLPEYIRRLNRESIFAGREFAALDVRQPPKEDSGAQAGAASAASGGSQAANGLPYVDFVLKPLRPANGGEVEKDVRGAAQ